MVNQVKHEPDKRWRARYEKACEAIEALEDQLVELATLDADATPAVWSEYVTEAVGSLRGAKALVHLANEARDAHVLGEWPCKHNRGKG